MDSAPHLRSFGVGDQLAPGATASAPSGAGAPGDRTPVAPGAELGLEAPLKAVENGSAPALDAPGAQPVHVIEGAHGRIACVADVRGAWRAAQAAGD